MIMVPIEKPEITQAIRFLVNKAYLCAYIKNVIKVLPLMELESVPKAPSYLVGIMNIEGKTIPVIDLARRLGLKRNHPYSLDMPIILCTNGQSEVGMIVDKLLQLIEIDESTIQMHEKFKSRHSLFMGTVLYQSEPTLIINLNQILKISLIGDYDALTVEDKT